MLYLVIYLEWDIQMIDSFVALDVETSGLNPDDDKIIEIGMAKILDGELIDKYSTLINPRRLISPNIVELTGITQDMLADKPVIEDIIGDILEFIGDYPILGHNVNFDYGFLKKAAVNSGYSFEKQGIDTLRLARRLLPEVEHKNLDYLCSYFGIDAGNSHRAYDDAVSAWKLFLRLYSIKPDDEGFNELITLNHSAKRDVPSTPAQRKYLMALLDMHGISLAEDIDSLTKSRASKIIDGIISQYGR